MSIEAEEITSYLSDVDPLDAIEDRIANVEDGVAEILDIMHKMMEGFQTLMQKVESNPMLSQLLK